MMWPGGRHEAQQMPLSTTDDPNQFSQCSHTSSHLLQQQPQQQLQQHQQHYYVTGCSSNSSPFIPPPASGPQQLRSNIASSWRRAPAVPTSRPYFHPHPHQHQQQQPYSALVTPHSGFRTPAPLAMPNVAPVAGTQLAPSSSGLAYTAYGTETLGWGGQSLPGELGRWNKAAPFRNGLETTCEHAKSLSHPCRNR